MRPRVITADSSDEELDRPVPVYGPDKKPFPMGEELDRERDPKYRKEHGLPPLPVVPPRPDS